MTGEKTWHVGLTFLVPPVPGGRWLCGAVLFGLLLGLFHVAGVFRIEDSTLAAGNQAAALFFAVIIAYIIPVFHYISERTVAALTQLAPDLEVTATGIEPIQRRIHYKSPRWFAYRLALGAGAAIAHNIVLAGTQFGPPDTLQMSTWLAMMFGTTATWLVMTLVIAALIDNALLLNRLARTVRINLLNHERLRPFAVIAVLSTLAIIGAQAAFPIMILSEAANPVAFLPGLLATSIPMLTLALLPIWPLHQRLKTEKHALLTELHERVHAETLQPGGTVAEKFATMAPLLAYRREIAALSEWPVDLRIAGRLLFYLFIPPATWVAAALIQNMVDALL